MKNIIKDDMSIIDSEFWLGYLDLEETDEEKYLEIENNCEIDFKN